MQCDRRHRTRQSTRYRLTTHLYQRHQLNTPRNEKVTRLILCDSCERNMHWQTRPNCGHATNATDSGQFDHRTSNAITPIEKFRRSNDENRIPNSNRLEFRRKVNVE